jgi:uncharacterized protein
MNPKFILAFVLIISFLISAGCKDQTSIKKVCHGQQCFDVEIAADDISREQGLMFRKSLSQGTGMLFVFDRMGLYQFWMKNTEIPLDMIWMDENYRIVYIKHQAQPCTQDPCDIIGPDVEAKYVLEINAGSAENLGIKVNETMTLMD